MDLRTGTEPGKLEDAITMKIQRIERRRALELLGEPLPS
jgi:hypothetical protein